MEAKIMWKRLYSITTFLSILFAAIAFLYGCVTTLSNKGAPVQSTSQLANSSYFLACKEGTIFYKGDSGAKNKNFNRGDLFEVRNAYELNNPRKACWSDSGDLKCLLEVQYGNILFHGGAGIMPINGYVDIGLGCWFKSDTAIPIKDNSNANSENFFKTLNLVIGGRIEEYFNKSLDKQFVDAMCSPHSTQFSVDGYTFTDIKMEKSEERVEVSSLYEEERKERIRQEEKAKEEQARIEREKQRILREKEAAKLKAWQEEIRRKYGVEKVEMIGDLENNPYEYEGRTIAVLVQFKKMLSSTSAIFFSGYTNLSDLTGAPDQIIVTGIPKGTHFKGGFMAPRVMLALKGKGTIEGTNAFGARINAPHFQWVGLIYRE